jgi:hypothetical protein
MVLLGDEAQLEARFGPFGDSANLDARLVHGLRLVYQSRQSFCTHSIKLPGDLGHVESCFGLFGDAVSVGAR